MMIERPERLKHVQAAFQNRDKGQQREMIKTRREKLLLNGFPCLLTDCTGRLTDTTLLHQKKAVDPEEVAAAAAKSAAAAAAARASAAKQAEIRARQKAQAQTQYSSALRRVEGAPQAQPREEPLSDEEPGAPRVVPGAEWAAPGERATVNAASAPARTAQDDEGWGRMAMPTAFLAPPASPAAPRPAPAAPRPPPPNVGDVTAEEYALASLAGVVDPVACGLGGEAWEEIPPELLSEISPPPRPPWHQPGDALAFALPASVKTELDGCVAGHVFHAHSLDRGAIAALSHAGTDLSLLVLGSLPADCQDPSQMIVSLAQELAGIVPPTGPPLQQHLTPQPQPQWSPPTVLPQQQWQAPPPAREWSQPQPPPVYDAPAPQPIWSPSPAAAGQSESALRSQIHAEYIDQMAVLKVRALNAEAELAAMNRKCAMLQTEVNSLLALRGVGR